MEDLKRTRGRPAYHPSPMQCRLVELLTAKAVPQAEISRILNISEKTLRLRFRRQLDRGGAKLEAALVGNLLRIANGKDATALKAIIFILRARFGWSEFLPPA